jgi:plastocyanin
MLTAGLLLCGIAFGAACSADEGGREVAVTQTDDACTPETVTAAAGEKLKFVIANQGSKTHELEGIEGTKFEEVAVPNGKTRTQSWTAPGSAGEYKLKCYIPGGSSTIITVQVS